MIEGIKVLFTDGRNEQALIFVAGQDTPETVVDMTSKLEESGWIPVKGSAVPMVYDLDRGWVRREFEPTMRQKLGFKPIWKIA